MWINFLHLAKTMHKIYLILWKDLLIRKNQFILTALEILLPTFIMLLTNITSFPENEPPNTQFMNDTVYPNCITDEVEVFMKIIYEPQNIITKEIMSNVKCYGGFANIVPGIIDNNSDFKIGVKFESINDSLSNIPHSLFYVLYPTAKYWNNINELWKSYETKGYSYITGQLKKFLRLQHAINYSFLKIKNMKIPEISFSNMDLFSGSTRIWCVAVIASFCFSFLFMVPTVVSRIVQEKSTGAKELMLMMGIKKWHLWIAKLMDSLIIFGVMTSFMVFFLFVPLKNNSYVITHVSPLITWSFIMYGLIGIVIFLFFMSCLFNNSTIAVYITQLFWMFTFLIYIVLATTFSSKASRMQKLLSCLFPHVCFLNGISILLNFDFYEKSVRLDERLSKDESFLTLSDNLLMIGFDIIFYSILIWYLEEIRSCKFGTPKPYGFCFMKSYWFPNKSEVSVDILHQKDNDEHEDFDPVPDRVNVGISIKKLTKKYKYSNKGSVLAVDNISIDFYDGEISALLGHNGAGKTTVFSIITGLTYATSGKVIINGYDTAINAENARSSLGLCPQQDMLFNNLNVFQIIYFFGMIKGLTKKEACREADEFIKKFKLDNVKKSWASTLSGGQKRKVSLAIALIGGSKVVILDEPTSGMDPEIRREIWEVLLKLRGSRSILFTTHFMEEADALSDRIAIMDRGKIKYYGTPMYLKSKYGSGYTLSLVINFPDKINEMTNFLQKFVKKTKFKSHNVHTITYQLPETEISNFPMLLAALNEKEEKGEIVSYCLSFSVFEDVFIKIRSRETENGEVLDVFNNSSTFEKLNCSDEIKPSKVNAYILPFYQFYALLEKKWIYFKRNITFYLVFSVIPLLLIIARFYIFPLLTANNEGNENIVTGFISYALDLYRNSIVLYSSNSSNDITETFKDLIERHGLELHKVPNIKKEIEDIFLKDFYTYARKLILAVEFLPNEIKVFYNSEATHILPASLNVLFNSILGAQYKNNYINTSVDLRYSYKEEKMLNEFFETMEKKTFSCSAVDITDFIGLQILFYLLGPIKESVQGAKHLQLIITSTNIYWISHLLFDLASFLVYFFVTLMLFYFSSQDNLVQIDAGELIPSFLLWAVGLILIVYLLSSFINNAGAASALYLIIYFCFSLFVFNLVRWQIWPMELRFLHPSSIFKIGFFNICQKEKDNYKTALIFYDIFLYICLILKDCHIVENAFHMLMNKILKINYCEDVEKDSEVKDHEEFVKNIISGRDLAQSALIVDDLKRWYFSGLRPRIAVQGISFAVENGECFGLLGVNGAGKTTTFKLMTGLIPPSHGKAFVNEVNLFSFREKAKAFHQIGYCPQFGGVIPAFSGKELLRLFARLRGIPGTNVARETLRWIEELDLMEHADSAVEHYSGGNQRKLSVALSVIGDPSVIFLDEPTSGVDPVARRRIWKVISNLRKEGKSVVLTSHSMDECEALCTRLAIMVNGRFRCNGEITTLKNKFGQGYSVQLKISADATAEEFSAIKEAMSLNFEPGCDLTDEHLTILDYHISNENIKWDALFSKLNNIKETFHKVESFSATATTLEQIFINFARNQ